MSQTRQPSYIDLPLFTVVLMLFAVSLIVLYSATGENLDQLIRRSMHMGFALVAMLVFTRISPAVLSRWSPNIYGIGLGLLFIVLAIGVIGKGAQRWIDWGIRFQPAEVMKIAVPMMVAWSIERTPLPPSPFFIILSVLIVLVPTVLIILQPDLGTGLLIALAGIVVIFLAGIGWRLILSVLLSLAGVVPAMWVFVLHDYQRSRVITLFDPWTDPLGVGYHIIQSMIAIGSGGVQGKGWLSGSQSQLEFIPEQRTDFIFSVYAEEFGLIGIIVLLILYLFLVFRGLLFAFHARDTYSRLLAGGISATFFFYVFANIGMVSGILPVVGIPLPLVSYGGTSLVTLMIGIGILMSIGRDSKLRGDGRNEF